MKSDSFVYNNLEFSSKQDCCAFYGISDDYVSRLARKNGVSFLKTLDSILNDNAFEPMRSYRVRAAHHDWVSIDYCCKSLGINIKKLLSYLYSNIKSIICDFRKAKWFVDNYVHDNGLLEDSDIEIDGKLYNCARYCYDNGIKWYAVCLYVAEHDVTVEEAIFECSKTDRFEKKKYRGVVYDSVYNLHHKLGVGENCNAVHRAYNISIYDAIDYCVLHDRFKIKARGTKFVQSSIFDCTCNKCGNNFLFTRDLSFKHIDECYGGIVKFE